MLEFISYGEQGHARTKDSPGCVMISFAASVCTLLMQAFIIAFFVDRVRQPISKLCVPSRMCVLQRNGKLYLSMRLFHPHGHLLSDTVVHTVWMRPVETDEGEHFLEPEAISFEGPWDMRYIFLPALMLHPLEGSPLARYAAELNEAPGRLVVVIKAYDQTARISLFERHTFSMADIEYGHWHSIVPPAVSLEPASMRTTVDLLYFDDVYPNDAIRERARELFGTLGGPGAPPPARPEMPRMHALEIESGPPRISTFERAGSSDPAASRAVRPSSFSDRERADQANALLLGEADAENEDGEIGF